jgi:hypothetical protein
MSNINCILLRLLLIVAHDWWRPLHMLVAAACRLLLGEDGRGGTLRNYPAYLCTPSRHCRHCHYYCCRLALFLRLMPRRDYPPKAVATFDTLSQAWLRVAFLYCLFQLYLVLVSISNVVLLLPVPISVYPLCRAVSKSFLMMILDDADAVDPCIPPMLAI